MEKQKSGAKIVTREVTQAEQAGMSRRGFLTGSGIFAGGAMLGALVGCAPQVSEGGEQSGEAIAKAKGHVVHMSEICTGCQTCALACVLTHEGFINPKMGRNTVKTDVQVGYVTDVMYCQQCDDPKCLKACQTGALHVDETTGARVINQDTCVGCQDCLNACIFAPMSSRIKYNAETKKCYKCDLCGGEPACVKYCPMGASMLSWKEYTIVRPQIDDYVVKEVSEGAIEGIVISKDYSGPHAGKAQDEKPWAVIKTDTGVQVQGQVTSSDGAELRLRFFCDFYDASGNKLGTSAEHQWCLTMHESLPMAFDFDIADSSQIASVTLVGNISYWISTEDKEY